VLFLAEGPSYEEDKKKIPLAGKTGFEFDNTYLPIVGLPRSFVAITNACMCSQVSYDNPTSEDAASCSGLHLSSLLEEVQPEIIVVMGAVACSLWPEINLTLQHGIPMKGRWGGWHGVLWPTYHPSAGIHQAAYMIPLMKDFDELRKFMRAMDQGDYQWPVDSHPTPDYRVIKSVSDFREYVEVYGDAYTPPIVGDDTESTKLQHGDVYCMTMSLAPGSGRLIYARDKELISEYRQWAHEKQPLQIFHNWLHDDEPFEQLGLPIEPFYDTMVRAYNLCLGGGADDDDDSSRAGRGSLSLKVLAYRHLSMSMTSFKDTVYPWSKLHAADWLSQGEAIFRKDEWTKPCATCHHPQISHQTRGKTQRHTGPCVHTTFKGLGYCDCTKYKPLKKPPTTSDEKRFNQLYLKITNLILDLESVPTTDPWARVKQWGKDQDDDWDQRTITDVLGPIPQPSIIHVPESELTVYACRDADADRRLYFKMEHMKPWVFYEE
jgi:uracil-DNA glycosylase family 4